MGEKSKATNGGKHMRIGLKFHKDIEDIKDERLKNGNSKERVSTEKITNLIIKHDSWGYIRQDLIEAPEEEINQYGI